MSSTFEDEMGIKMASLTSRIKTLTDATHSFANHLGRTLKETSQKNESILKEAKEIDEMMPPIILYKFAPPKKQRRWRQEVVMEGNLFTADSRPEFLQKLVEETIPMPELAVFDQFRNDGKSCVNDYSDPSFLRAHWIKKEILRQEEMMKRKNERRKKEKVKIESEVAKAEGVTRKVFLPDGTIVLVNEKGETTNLSDKAKTDSVSLPSVPPPVVKIKKESETFKSASVIPPTPPLKTPKNSSPPKPPKQPLVLENNGGLQKPKPPRIPSFPSSKKILEPASKVNVPSEVPPIFEPEVPKEPELPKIDSHQEIFEPEANVDFTEKPEVPKEYSGVESFETPLKKPPPLPEFGKPPNQEIKETKDIVVTDIPEVAPPPLPKTAPLPKIPTENEGVSQKSGLGGDRSNLLKSIRQGKALKRVEKIPEKSETEKKDNEDLNSSIFMVLQRRAAIIGSDTEEGESNEGEWSD